MRLDELKPRMSWPGERYQSLYFLCPICQRHEIGIEIWHGPSGFHDVGLKDANGAPVLTKLWHGEQGPARDWDTLTITPSISAGGSERSKCAGWHGTITNGEVLP